MRRTLGYLAIVAIVTFAFVPVDARSQGAAPTRVRSLKVIVLSTMLAEQGVGEWGFSALVEVDGRRILFDTGLRSDTVLQNAKELGVDLAGVTDVVISHNHRDHTGGLLRLRQELAKVNPAALSRAHVAPGIFWSRPRTTTGAEGNAMIATKAAYEAKGGVFVEHKEPVQLYPGVWVTGSVPRVHPEQSGGGWGDVTTPDGPVEDSIPEDMSLVFDTDKGLVLLAGCGHAGLVNTLEHARARVRKTSIYAAIGGFHLFNADDAKLDWTAKRLRELGLRHLLGGHCTGIEAVYRLRQQAGLDRRSCVVSAVGSSFALEGGIDPLTLAR